MPCWSQNASTGAWPCRKLGRGIEVGALGTRDLAMTSVMADEPRLGEHHRQEHANQQLQPGAAEDAERGPSAGEQDQVDAYLDPVIALMPTQQPGCRTVRESLA